MRRILVSVVVLLLVSLTPVWAEVLSLDYEGRPILLDQPDGSAGKSLPLIVVLHGASLSGNAMLRSLPLLEAAPIQNFRVAYLNSTQFTSDKGREVRAWNDGVCCGTGIRPDADDSAYVADAIGYFRAQGLTGGRDMVALVGHSNGAQMGYRLACEHGNLFASLVAISGAIAERNCSGTSGLRVLNINGTADERYPVAGGRSAFNQKITHDSIEGAQNAIQSEGASTEQILVQGAGHSIASLDGELRAAGKPGLATTVLNFIFARTSN